MAIHQADEAFTQITATRLIIRRFHPTDAARFLAMRNTEAVARYQDWPMPFSEKDCTAFIQHATHSHPDTAGQWFQFALADCSTDALIGDIGVCPDADNSEGLEIGFSLHPDHQGKGMMWEALTAIFDYWFNQRGKKRILAVADTDNAPSWHLLERLGFVREKTSPADPAHGDAAVAEYAYLLTSTRWQASLPADQ